MRNEFQLALYQRLLDFSVDSGGEELTFAARLGRENGWTPSFTNRVMVEYKRFLFLAVVAGHPVTPSDQVDQAWHLHLTYTRSYWDKLCGEVLGKPLHHGPTRGGKAESRKFDDWYSKTLESYRLFFDEEPPADLWPPSSVRFGEDLHYQRVNTKRNWLFPVPRILAGIRAKPSWVFIFCAVLAVAIASSSFVSGSGNSTPQGEANIYMAGVSEWEYETQIVGILVAGSLLIFALWFSSLARQRQCPKCSKYFALVRVLSTDENAEGKCKYCRYSGPWKPLRDCGGSGGGGCGGCGGCGG